MKMITRTSTVAVPNASGHPTTKAKGINCQTQKIHKEYKCKSLYNNSSHQPHLLKSCKFIKEHYPMARKLVSSLSTLLMIISTHLLLIHTLLIAISPAVVTAIDLHNGSGASVVSSSTIDAHAPPLLPHAAALASPEPGAGGSSSGTSSILEQFSPNCTAVSHLFQARGINVADIPSRPSNDMVLRYCESPTVGTCCTYTMETKLAMQSRAKLEDHTKHQIAKMSSLLSAKSQKFNEVFRKLLLESKEEFHNMFTRTYGVIYQQNSYVFSDLFNELENYYARGRVDLIDVMDKFFNTLYQKMFQVLNAQYSFDEKYLRCVSEHMKELKPFGDVPDKLSVQIKRSFVATRTYGQALATAAEVSKKLLNVRFNADCTAALTKMQHCGACKGYAEKPCTNYCVNVIKGCLHHFHELDIEWENFAMAMDRVAERLLGSFNIVMVVEPINIKISEAIMNFQDAGQDIKNRVFQGCGRPSLGRSRRSVNPKLLALPNTEDIVKDHHITLQTLPVANQPVGLSSQADQIESDILDIDAQLDDAIVLRERRAADPGSRVANIGSNPGDVPYGSEEQGASGVSGGGGASRGGSGGGGNNRRNQRRKQQQNRNNEDSDYNGHDPVLDKLVRDIRQRVKDFKKFWSNLPHQICSNDNISSSSDADGMCWNGHTIDRYMHSVTTEHGRNPEFPANPTTPRQMTQVSTQLYYLKNAISHLRNAYNGQDVNWSDQEEPYYGSGSGSGGGSDDEDDDEGSGLGGNIFTPSHRPEHTDHPSVRINNIDDEDAEDIDEHVGGSIVPHTSRPKYTGTTGGAGGTGTSHETNIVGEHDDVNNHHGSDGHGQDHDDEDDGLDQKSSGSGSSSTAKPPPQMSLRRALLLYMLPLYMAWFGGLCAELL